MSHPADEHSDLSAPALPAPGVASTMTAPQPGTASPSLPAPGTPSHTLDGDAPRLGSSTPTVAAAPPAEAAPTPAAPEIPAGLDLPSLPSLPTAAPVLTSPTGIPSPDDAPVLAAATPTVPTGDSTNNTGDTSTDETDQDDDAATSNEPVHPMAHLMPEKAAPSEASMKAAAIRAAKKKKAKKIKLGVAAGFLVVTVVVGPPLWSWLTNAINESGSVSTDEPAG